VLHGVILCHGYLANQAKAQQDFDEARRMIDVNYTSAVSILNVAASYFEARQAGFVCALSSVAGDCGRQSNHIYGSTKAALNTYLEGLRVRLAKAGVPVTTVKPSFVDTRMTRGQPGMFLVAKPERVARDICRAIRRRRGVVYTPWFWWGIMAIVCAIPTFLFNRLKL
jgi:short-subunit dehydrogenase